MPADDMRWNVSSSLNLLVWNKFKQALTTKSLIFSDTHLTVLRNKAGIPFQLRFCPALSKKPVNDKQTTQELQPPTTPRKKFDPFEDPSSDLLIARIPDSVSSTHNLVLNKYPVIPNHFILATRENQPQTNLLTQADIALTYGCLQSWQDNQHHKLKLYAFFNSGEHSGASQPHRHLQFLPIEDMRGSESASVSQWDLLCSRMTIPLHTTLDLLHDPSLPILHLAVPLSSSDTPSQLHEKYLLLLRASVVLLNSHSKPSVAPPEILHAAALDQALIATESGRTTISYNLAITTEIMAILPRRAEDAMIDTIASNTGGIGTVSINGTILAGTLMVKNEAEWEALKTNQELLDSILKQIGYSKHEVSRI